MTPLTELTLESAPKALWKEFLAAYFDGAAHAVGAHAVVAFPAVGLAFGQGAIEQPLAAADRPGGVQTSAEIRVLCLPRRTSVTANSNALDGVGLLATDHVTFQFQIRARKPRSEDANLLADQIAQLLKALLTNPDCRYPLARNGITHLEPSKPATLAATDWALRLLHCAAQLQYPIQFGDTLATVGGDVVLTVQTADPAEQSLAFTREAPLVVGEYLLGWYRWSVPMLARSATIVGLPGVNDTVLGLEVNGTLTGQTLTLPAGVRTVEATANGDLGYLVLARDAGVRWKVLSGAADVGLAAWHVTVTLQVQPQ